MNTEQKIDKESTMKRMTTLFAIFSMLALPVVQAQEMEHHHQDTTVAAPAGAMSTGEVTRVDTDTGKITLRHGPLANLDMPGMTMAFKVADPAMLVQVKAGDKVRFVVERGGAGLTITTLEAAN